MYTHFKEVLRDFLNSSKQEEYVEIPVGKLGYKLVAVNLLTQWQRHFVVEKQRILYSKGIDMKFGKLVAQVGYCTPQQLEDVMSNTLHKIISKAIKSGCIGEKMVSAKIITPSQLDLIINEQDRLNKLGTTHHLLGQVAIKHKFCTEEHLNSIIDGKLNRHIEAS